MATIRPIDSPSLPPPLWGTVGSRPNRRSNPGRAARWLAVSLLAVASLGGHGCRNATQTGPLRWASDAEGGAPYIFRDPEHPSQVIGFEVDLAKALSRQLGREIRFEQYEYEKLLPGLDRGDADLAMNGLEVTPDRAERYRLSLPYYVYKEQLVCRADDDRFKSLDDCQRLGAEVGTLGDTAAERLLDKLGIKTRVYSGQVEPYSDLALKRIDAVLLDLPIALYNARPKQMTLKFARSNEKLKYVGEPIAEGRYAIAFRKDQEALAQQFDAAIERLAQRGELKRIYEKWGLWNADQERLGQTVRDDVTTQSRQEWTFRGYAPLLVKAAGMTVLISVAGMTLAIVLGLCIATLRMYSPPPFRWAAVAYVEFFRGIPVLLLLYFIYYGLPGVAEYYHLNVSLTLDPLTAAILAFGLNYAAYEAEIYRAGIGAVPHGQWEAAASLGMSPAASFFHIILPQAIRTILPPMTNDFVALFKDTSIVSVIAVVELTKEYQILSKSSMMYLEIGAVTAALYLVMSVPLGYLSHYLERRWSKGVR